MSGSPVISDHVQGAQVICDGAWVVGSSGLVSRNTHSARSAANWSRWPGTWGRARSSRQRGAVERERPERATGGANRRDLGVRRRLVFAERRVDARAEHLAVAHDQRAERQLASPHVLDGERTASVNHSRSSWVNYHLRAES